MNNTLLYSLFALSGIAGLIYEGTWARYLKLFLGHSSYGQILTLCIYMGGLALGSFIAGRFVTRIKRPLLAYSITELFICVGGMLYHPIYIAATNIFYDSEMSKTLGQSGAEAIKIAIATISTLPIATLLGMTFPFIAAGISRIDGDNGKKSLPLLYFTNSLGACIGILFASYILIPTLGNANTLRIAALINFTLFLFFWRISTGEASPSPSTAFPATPSAGLGGQSPPLRTPQRPYKTAHFWLLFSALTGLSSFIYEIVWIRLLSLLMGSSSHSFDQMLSAFILGLALGGLACKKLLAKGINALLLLASAQILMAFFAVCTLYFHVPFFSAMNEAHQIFNQTSTGYVFWSAFKYFLAVLWMVPTSFFAGMTLPILTYWLINKTREENDNLLESSNGEKIENAQTMRIQHGEASGESCTNLPVSPEGDKNGERQAASIRRGDASGESYANLPVSPEGDKNGERQAASIRRGDASGESYIGKVYGWNTLGSILGSVGAGILLLPHLQLKGTLLVGVFIDLALGLWILRMYQKQQFNKP